MCLLVVPGSVMITGLSLRARQSEREDRHQHEPKEAHGLLQVDDAISFGRCSVAETLSRSHIPARPCPGTAQKIR